MNNTKDDGGFAFPCENDFNKYYNWINKGMTLRDYFAAASLPCALQAWKHHFKVTNEPEEWVSAFELASEAYLIADAMLQARKES